MYNETVMNPIHPDSMGDFAVGGTAVHDREEQIQRVVSQRASRRPLTLGSGRGRLGWDCGQRTFSIESPSAGKVNCFGRDVDSGSERRRGFGDSGSLCACIMYFLEDIIDSEVLHAFRQSHG